MVEGAEDYPWSSAAFHLGLKGDKLIKSKTMWGKPVEDWENELASPEDDQMLEMIRSRTHSGFPCGDEAFVAKISELLGRPFVLRGKGRPRKG